ncbi:MAG: methyltransferase domain-containing protein [Clostridiales bacterium]|nr:methyltransferase domain-containing protein [Clostridiales bacterium]
MKDIVGLNIARYRKSQNLTQDELAKQLSITYQAVSKWENGITKPDVSLLPVLASILNVSIDSLMGYSHNFDPRSYYEDVYNNDEYFWGVQPSAMCLKVLELMPPTKPLSLLDIGCGEGKDAVFFARCGYQVSAFDISNAGIEKTKKLAEKANVYVDVFKANILDFRLEKKYDILFSNGVLHHVKPELREEIFSNYKEFTKDGGINALQCLIEKPFISDIPGKYSLSEQWKSGQLFTLYHDWYLEECSEDVFDCNSSGIPHKHAVNRMYARKMTTVK